MATVVVKHNLKTNAAPNPAVLVDGSTWDNDPHIVTGLDQINNTSDANKPVSTAQAAAIAAITKTSIGLGNVDNTSDVNKPVSTAQATALALKAPLASPALTGSVVVNDNTGAPVAPSFSSPIQMVGADATITALTIDTYGAAGLINMRTAGGTRASKTAVLANTQLFNLAGSGWNGSAYVGAGPMVMFSGENWSGTANGTYASFFTVPNTTTAQVEGMRLQGSGGLTLGNSILTTDPGAGSFLAAGLITTKGAGIGYAPGAGGTVTQATSKATGVTLNKASGQITLNNAALASNTVVAFVLTDSAIAATDTMSVQVVSGNATVGTYQVWAEKATAGTMTICVRNISAGSLSEALILQFNLVKGVNS